MVIRDYLTVDAADRSRSSSSGRAWRRCRAGEVPELDRLADGLVYLTLQELATRISHRNTGVLLDDPAGCDGDDARVAADENLHHLFYRDLASAAIERATVGDGAGHGACRCARSRCPVPVSPTSRATPR